MVLADPYYLGVSAIPSKSAADLDREFDARPLKVRIEHYNNLVKKLGKTQRKEMIRTREDRVRDIQHKLNYRWRNLYAQKPPELDTPDEDGEISLSNREFAGQPAPMPQIDQDSATTFISFDSAA